jgi:hypothetical protein
LIKSDLTTLNLIGKFIQNAANDKSNAHAFANHFLIAQLSQKLFDKDYVTEKEKWVNAGNTAIQKCAKELYDSHTKAIEKAGATQIRTYIGNIE